MIISLFFFTFAVLFLVNILCIHISKNFTLIVFPLCIAYSFQVELIFFNNIR